MGTYVEKLLGFDGERQYTVYELYEQAAWRHAVGQLLERITLRTGPLERALDPLAERVHGLRCNDDCHTGEVSRIRPEWLTPDGRRRPEVVGIEFSPEAHPEVWETKVETYCARLPLSAAVDLSLYDFGHRGRKRIGELETDRDEE